MIWTWPTNTTVANDLGAIAQELYKCDRPTVHRYQSRSIPLGTGRLRTLHKSAVDPPSPFPHQSYQITCIDDHSHSATLTSVIGFAGHRDLTSLGAESDLALTLSKIFLELAADHRAGRLISGFASGADHLAVKVWNDLALPSPRLVFPFAETRLGLGTVFFVDDPAMATPVTAFPEAALARLGTPSLPDKGIGHAAQAATILARAAVLVAIVDETRLALPGGTVHTVARARAAGLPVIVIGPERGARITG